MTPTLDPEFDYPTGSAALFHNHAASRSARVCIRCGKPNDCILYLLCLECHDADLAMSTALSIVVYECENPLNLFPAGTDLAAGTSPRCACFEKVGDNPNCPVVHGDMSAEGYESPYQIRASLGI